MVMAAQNNILERLEKIEKTVDAMKEQLADGVMTEEDYESLLRYRQEKKTGKLISHAALKKQMGF